jgi:hypothetical protein
MILPYWLKIRKNIAAHIRAQSSLFTSNLLWNLLFSAIIARRDVTLTFDQELASEFPPHPIASTPHTPPPPSPFTTIPDKYPTTTKIRGLSYFATSQPRGAADHQKLGYERTLCDL